MLTRSLNADSINLQSSSEHFVARRLSMASLVGALSIRSGYTMLLASRLSVRTTKNKSGKL